jgi:signal transduction histidine kinase
MVIRNAATLAWSMWALSLILSALALLFDLLTPFLPMRGPTGLAILYLALAFAYPTVGALVASRRPRNPIGWIFCAVGLAQSFQFFATTYADYTLSGEGTLPAAGYMAWLAEWIAIPVVAPSAVLLLLLFPTGRLPSRIPFVEGRMPGNGWRAVAWMAVCGGATSALWLATSPGPSWSYPDVYNPHGIEGAVGSFLTTLLGGATNLLLLGSAFCAVASLIDRMIRARGEERQQLKWFMFAVAVFVVGFSGAPLPVSYQISEIFWFIGVFGFSLLPVAVGIAILRYRLWDIDLLVNRALVYGLLTVTVVGLYVLVVGGLGALFQASGNLLISLLATGLAAVLFQPMRSRLQRGVNRLMYGERNDPYAVLSRLGRHLETSIAPEAALSTIVETVAEALKLPYVAIELNEEGAPRKAWEYGTPVGKALTTSLIHHSDQVGRMLVAPRSLGEEFSSLDKRLLDDLARQAGAAAHAARLTADLQRSRERLVKAREEERRRLRRDLHDGLGPTLGGITLGLDAARSSLPVGSDQIRELLSQLKLQTQEAVSDIRRLVHGLRPPALDDLGLQAAIRQEAAKHGRVAQSSQGASSSEIGRENGLTFSVEASHPLPPLPAAVEVAAYRVAQEAITNVSRHAEAKSCRVVLSVDEARRSLALEVVDDGIGIPKDRRAGVGTSSMRERAEELGGSLTVGPAPEGGTRVLARLPLPGTEKEEE